MDAVTKGQKNLLIFILGVLILFLPIRFLAMKNFDEKKEIQADIDEKEVYYNDLKAKDNNRAELLKETDEYKADYEEVLNEFPAELYQENVIMTLQGFKNQFNPAGSELSGHYTELNFTDLSLGEETLFYQLGSGAIGDVTLDGDAEMAGTASGMNCYYASFPMAYEGTYENVKSLIKAINNNNDRMTVDAIAMSFNESTGLYEGELTFTAYSVTGGDRAAESVTISGVMTGKDCIFGNPSTAAPTTGATE